MKIIWSPLAVDRVAEIANYIAKDKPAAAEKCVENIFSKTQNLASFPEAGRMVPEINLEKDFPDTDNFFPVTGRKKAK